MSDNNLKAAKSFTPEQSAQMTETQLAPAKDHQQQQWQEQEPELNVVTPPPRRSRLWGLFGIAVLLLVVAESGWTLWQAWLRGPLWIGLYGAVFAGAGILIVRLLWRELSRLKQLKRNQQQRLVGERLADSSQSGESAELLQQLAKQLPSQFDAGKQQWLQSQQDHHNDAEQLQLYEATVIRHQDEAAQRCIYRYAAQASLLLAASPMASLDMALMLWRNQSMLDEVARIYGIEPGYWSRVRLVRQMVNNLLFAGGSQVALDLGTQMLSAELTGKLSARLAQGLGAGLLTARLGYAACAECRPLPYRSQQRPSLLTVQGKLLSELKSVSADALNQARAASPSARHRNEQFTSSGRQDPY